MEPLHEGEVFIFAVAEVAKRNAQGLAAWRACGERHLGIEPGTEDPESTRTGDRAVGLARRGRPEGPRRRRG